MEIENSQGIRIYSEVIESNAFEVCKEVRTILDRLQMKSDINTDQCFDIKVILCELLQNAIKHGNQCEGQKKIGVDVWLQDNSQVLGITIKDQGCGFDPSSTMDLKFTQISECKPMNLDESGRGLFIVQNLCDCMEFSPQGNTVTIKKRL